LLRTKKCVPTSHTNAFFSVNVLCFGFHLSFNCWIGKWRKQMRFWENCFIRYVITGWHITGWHIDFHTILDESKFVWTEWLWMVIFLVIWARPVQKVPKLVGGVTQSKAADFALLPSIFCVVKRTQPQVARYPPPPEDRIFPPGENLPPLWEPLRYAHKR